MERPLQRAEPSSGGVLPTVVCRFVWCINLNNEATMARVVLLRQRKRKRKNIGQCKVPEILSCLWIKSYDGVFLLRCMVSFIEYKNDIVTYGLLNSAVMCSDCTASNEKSVANNELGKTCRMRLWCNLSRNLGICLRRTEKNNEKRQSEWSLFGPGFEPERFWLGSSVQETKV